MTFQTEFPDFPASDMPAIPETFIDVSWHNDICPCFENNEGFRLFVDYADDSKREFPGGARFTLYPVDERGEMGADLVATDDWSEMAHELAEYGLR